MMVLKTILKVSNGKSNHIKEILWYPILKYSNNWYW